MSSPAGKVAIVTGASNGIGRAVVERLAQDGATVVVNYGKSADKAKAVVAEIEAKGGQAVYRELDVTKPSANDDIVKLAKEKYGRLDVIFPI